MRPLVVRAWRRRRRLRRAHRTQAELLAAAQDQPADLRRLRLESRALPRLRRAGAPLRALRPRARHQAAGRRLWGGLRRRGPLRRPHLPQPPRLPGRRAVRLLPLRRARPLVDLRHLPFQRCPHAAQAGGAEPVRARGRARRALHSLPGHRGHGRPRALLVHALRGMPAALAQRRAGGGGRRRGRLRPALRRPVRRSVQRQQPGDRLRRRPRLHSDPDQPGLHRAYRFGCDLAGRAALLGRGRPLDAQRPATCSSGCASST